MKNKTIKKSIILIIGSIIIKLLGAIIRITITRNTPIEELSIYMLILPTISLIITINELSLTKTITKQISDNKHNNKNLLISLSIISLLINIILTIIILLTSKQISLNLLKNINTYKPLLLIPILLPFNSISSILKGYYYGKINIIPIIISNITENIIRLILITLTIKNTNNITISLIIINLISEIISVIILIILLPNKIKINKKDLKINKSYILESLNYSIPSTLTKLIYSITSFIEPIILNTIILNNIVQEYSILKAYILPILIVPTFISHNISEILLPKLTSTLNNKTKYKKIIKYSISISLIIGIALISFILIFKNQILNIIYKTNLGIQYLIILSPIFILHSIEPILLSILESLNKEKYILKTNIISNIIKSLVLLILSLLIKNIYSLIISIIIEILVTNTLYIIKIKKLIK